MDWRKSSANARIDCGIGIDVNVDDLRRKTGGRQAATTQWARSTTATAHRDIFCMLKASLTGDESEDINEYRIDTRSFPHEPTGQQFFNEGQF